MLGTQRKTGVPPIVDPVPNDGGQVLVAGIVKDKATPKLCQGAIASGLGPTVAVQVRHQVLLTSTMIIGQVAKNSLRKGDFQVRTLPIPRKVPEKSQLPAPRRTKPSLSTEDGSNSGSFT